MKHIFIPSVFSAKLALLSAAVILLVGCAPLPNQRHSVPEQQLSQSPLVAWATVHDMGSQTVMDDPKLGGKISAKLTHEYKAASGLLCKKVRVRNDLSLGEDVSICQSKDDSWFLAPGIRAGRGVQGGT